jgi:hypothetical protein
VTRRGGSRCRTLQLGLAGILGAGAALLVACGSNSALIPATDASQLKSDFDAVATEVSNGNCGAGVTAAVAAVRSDLSALPATVDARLLSALRTGVGTLSARAASECKTRTTSTGTTSTNTTSTNTNTGTTNTNTTTTNTNTNTNTNTTNTDTTPTDTTPTDTTPTDTTSTPTDTTPANTVPATGGGTPAPNGQTGQVAPGKSEASGGTPGGSG